LVLHKVYPPSLPISPGVIICSAPSGLDGCFFDELAGHSTIGNDVNPWNCFWGLHVFWLTNFVVQENETKLGFVEMFAGQAEATRMFRYANIPAARLDLEYMKDNHDGENPMDLLTDSGMAILGSTYQC
jgi:hypothetical protein